MDEIDKQGVVGYFMTKPYFLLPALLVLAFFLLFIFTLLFTLCLSPTSCNPIIILAVEKTDRSV